jgi:hypothetical protein
MADMLTTTPNARGAKRVEVSAGVNRVLIFMAINLFI